VPEDSLKPSGLCQLSGRNGGQFIIEAEPDRLKEVPGIGPWRASKIVAGWAEQKAVREIMIFLHAHGLGTARAVRIFKTYSYDAIGVMTENPYRLARDVRGIGFKTADAIAMKLGVEKASPQRLRRELPGPP
jgi:exodeoxyribonuclease V alpha subunit